MKQEKEVDVKESFAELIKVVSILRDPNEGCPWDLEQTHHSLIPYVLEEAQEVAHAIREETPSELKEELGDLLLQIILHAQIAKENKLFQITDIISDLTKKLIRRHPHVFQTKEKINIKKVKENWVKIKTEEKALKSSKSPITDQLKAKIRPHSATDAALIISKKAAKIGFEWEQIDAVWRKLYEELDELKEELNSSQAKNAESELGDVFFTLINLARVQNLSFEEGLAKTNKRFLERLTYIEKKIQGDFTSQNKQILNKYWESAKVHLNH